MKTLLEAGYDTYLASDIKDSQAVEQIYGLGKVLEQVHHVPLPPFNPVLNRFLAFQRLFYARKARNYFEKEWDIVFSTQSSIFSVTRSPLYHFIYDMVDLFSYPEIPFASPHAIPILGGHGLHWKVYYFLLKQAKRILLPQDPKPRKFLALSNKLRDDLQRNGYENAETLYPPCPLDFKPRPKKKQVLQVTRIVPQKRLEWFIEIARRLPQYRFIIVGRDTPILRKLNPRYREELFLKKPDNVDYVESPIRDCPHLLEESKVYLYTGLEPGIGIALVEAIGAGCIPIAPVEGGGGEVVRASKVGFQYRTLDEAVTMVRDALEDEYYRPEQIREQAKMFSSEAFQERIKRLF